MKALVTGATGFVGAHLARALLAQGAQVRCLVRPATAAAAARVDLLAGLTVELAVGDLRDAASLRAAVDGCDVVYHCAADYRLYAPDPRDMFASNVTGTDNLLQACAAAGVARVVYTSSVGALGLVEGGIADEGTPVTAAAMIGPYKRSKFEAERVAETWAARGLPVVIVNPSTPVGEGDVKPTPTGRMVVDFLRGKFPAYVDTGLNLIDVRDVAQGHLLAAQHGRPGERYILGHRNMTLKEILDCLALLTGLPAPRVRVPHWLPLGVAYVSTAAARFTGHTPRATPDAVRMSRHRMFFDATKAVRQLGLPQSPIEPALERAVAWFTANGYATKWTARTKRTTHARTTRTRPAP